jgi:hypothetical protein
MLLQNQLLRFNSEFLFWLLWVSCVTTHCCGSLPLKRLVGKNMFDIHLHMAFRLQPLRQVARNLLAGTLESNCHETGTWATCQAGILQWSSAHLITLLLRSCGVLETLVAAVQGLELINMYRAHRRVMIFTSRALLKPNLARLTSKCCIPTKKIADQELHKLHNT